MVFGLVVLGGTVGAFFAPPFTGLDTLPSLGVVLLALLECSSRTSVVIARLVVGVVGVVLAMVLGAAALHGISSIFLISHAPSMSSRAAAATAAVSRTCACRGSWGSLARLSSTSGTPRRTTLSASAKNGLAAHTAAGVGDGAGGRWATSRAVSMMRTSGARGIGQRLAEPIGSGRARPRGRRCTTSTS